MGLRILRCTHCGNTIIFQEDSRVTPICCGEKMQLLEGGLEEEFTEKHTPVIFVEKEETKEDGCSGDRTTKKGSCSSYATVQVGSTMHPMVDSHYIKWIMLATNLGVYTRFLEPGDEPKVTFCLGKGEKVINAYTDCNLHGMWQAE